MRFTNFTNPLTYLIVIHDKITYTIHFYLNYIGKYAIF